MNKKQLITGFLLIGSFLSPMTGASADLTMNKFSFIQTNQNSPFSSNKSLIVQPSMTGMTKNYPEKSSESLQQAAISNEDIIAAQRAAAIEAQNAAINQAVNGIITPGYDLIQTRDYADDGYPEGSCTWGAKAVAPWASNKWGNANEWPANALAAGFKTGSTPMVGAIASWSGGHVAVVIGVQANGKIQVLESNYAGNGNINVYRDYFDPTNVQGLVTYIYPPAGYGL